MQNSYCDHRNFDSVNQALKGLFVRFYVCKVEDIIIYGEIIRLFSSAIRTGTPQQHMPQSLCMGP